MQNLIAARVSFFFFTIPLLVDVVELYAALVGAIVALGKVELDGKVNRKHNCRLTALAYLVHCLHVAQLENNRVLLVDIGRLTQRFARLKYGCLPKYRSTHIYQLFAL